MSVSKSNHQRKWSCTAELLCGHANTYILLPTVLGLGNLQTCTGAHHKLQVSKALTSQCFNGAYLRGRASGAAGATATGVAFCALGFLAAALILSMWAWSARAWAAWTASVDLSGFRWRFLTIRPGACSSVAGAAGTSISISAGPWSAS